MIHQYCNFNKYFLSIFYLFLTRKIYFCRIVEGFGLSVCALTSLVLCYLSYLILFNLYKLSSYSKEWILMQYYRMIMFDDDDFYDSCEQKQYLSFFFNSVRKFHRNKD